MTTTAAHPTLPRSPSRDPYRFGSGPDLVLRPGTVGWSIEDLDDPEVHALWDQGRYEIHDGVLVEMPSSQFYGGAVVINLIRALDPYLTQRYLRADFAPEADIQVLPDRVVRGDTVAVWGDDRPKFDAVRFPPPRTHWSQHALTIPPTMVIESVSVGHEAMDRRTKRRWYAEFGVRHYWIVDGLRRTLDCLLLDGDQYRDDGSGREADVVRPGSLPGLDISLADVWVQ
jgi:Uma2 family endonuclease